MERCGAKSIEKRKFTQDHFNSTLPFIPTLVCIKPHFYNCHNIKLFDIIIMQLGRIRKPEIFNGQVKVVLSLFYRWCYGVPAVSTVSISFGHAAQ